MVEIELGVNMKYGLVLLAILLSGCQSLGEHYKCMAEVDRLVPAQTQQRYVRTDTKCVKSNEQTYQVTGGYTSKVYNPGQGDTNCSSVPIYETIILNKPQRDAAYQQCRNSINSQQSYSPPASSQNTSEEIRPPEEVYKSEEVRKYEALKRKCELIKNNDKYLACMRDAQNDATLKTKYSADTPYCKGISDKNSPEYKSQCQQVPTKNPQQLKPVGVSLIPFSGNTSMEQARQKCINLGFKVGTESYGQCVLKLAK